jgi:stage V sporulation protein G
MKVTSISVTLANEGRLRAYAEIVIDDGLAIHGLRIIEGDHGLFISMPSKTKPDGTFTDVVHPINRQAREMIEQSVLTEYQRLIVVQSNPELKITS